LHTIPRVLLVDKKIVQFIWNPEGCNDNNKSLQQVPCGFEKGKKI